MTALDARNATEGAPGGSRALRCSVLIADACPAEFVATLERRGCQVRHDAGLTAEALPEAVEAFDPDVLVVRSTKVHGPVFDAAGRLGLVIRAGAGVDNIDVATASARGVFVANCPGRNAIAVAEIVWALILACDRRVPDQTRDLREGIWDKAGYGKARGLYGRTLGIVGLGRIGEAVVTRARGFGMKTIAWSRSLTAERAEELDIRRCETPIDVARGADVVSIHVAATPETKHLVNESFLDAMKDGAYFINTSRGSVVDEAALARAIRAKGLRAGLDVFEQQPAPGDKQFADPIIKETGVYGTHHSGASTDQAQQAISAEALRIVEVYATTGVVPNCVNRAEPGSTPCTLTVRHLNRPGVLAHVLEVVSGAGLNVEAMENIIYDGAQAACARIELDAALTDTQLTAIRGSESILSVKTSG